MRVALVHDWLTGMRGGERVLESLVGMFPDSEIFTLLHVPGSVSTTLEDRRIHTTFVQHLPAAATRYRSYLPVFPWAVEQLDLSGFDLVISSSHCAAKAVITDPSTRHLCYCHTPMRYAWDQFDAYFSVARNGRLRYALIRSLMSWLRRWDRATADRVDAFAANSAFVADRIARYYGRAATVVPPPVDTDFFRPAAPGATNGADTGADLAAAGGGAGEPFYLVVSALAPYKRVDLVIDAFNRLGKRLVVVGTGPEAGRLAAMAGPTVEMYGWADRPTLRRLYQQCRGLLLAAVEDAGIVPLEAMSCGRPAIVLDRGGAREPILEGHNGILIHRQDTAGVIDAIDRAEAVSFNSAQIRTSALRYDPEHFVSRFSDFVRSALAAAPSAASSEPRAVPMNDSTTEPSH